MDSDQPGELRVCRCQSSIDCGEASIHVAAERRKFLIHLAAERGKFLFRLAPERGKFLVRLATESADFRAQPADVAAKVGEGSRLISDTPLEVGESFLYARHLAPIPPGR